MLVEDNVALGAPGTALLDKDIGLRTAGMVGTCVIVVVVIGEYLCHGQCEVLCKVRSVSTILCHQATRLPGLGGGSHLGHERAEHVPVEIVLLDLGNHLFGSRQLLTIVPEIDGCIGAASHPFGQWLFALVHVHGHW